jgi:hypothetical protein
MSTQGTGQAKGEVEQQQAQPQAQVQAKIGVKQQVQPQAQPQVGVEQQSQPQPQPQNAQQVSNVNAPPIKSILIKMGGKDVVVEKLKALPYYKAQTEFMKMLKFVQEKALKDSSNYEKMAKNNEKLKKYIESGKPMTSKALKEAGIDVSEDNLKFGLEAMGTLPDIMLEIVAIGMGGELQDIGNMFEPEEIPDAFNKIVKLNNFLHNIKNFVAPMQGLGA